MNNTILGKMMKFVLWAIIFTSVVLNTLALTWIALVLELTPTALISFESSSRDSAIYLRHDYYGVTSDSDVLIISPELRRRVIPNAITDFYGHNVGQVYYSFKDDTLFLHLEEVMPVPVVAPLEIVVVQRKLNYPDIYEMQKQGLVEEL